MRARQLPNGDLVYPRRGCRIPDEIPGYEQDENDPLHFKLLYESCCYRQLQQYGTLSCGFRKGNRDYCELKSIIVNPLVCKNCTERKENPTSD